MCVVGGVLCLADPLVAQAPPSLAIAPFENLSGNDDAWIGAGIAEALAAGLSERFVVSAGPASEARFLVHGAYQRQGDQIRITAQLVERATATVIASAKVDGPRSDLFALQDAVVAALLAPPAAGSGAGATRPGRTDPVMSPPEPVTSLDVGVPEAPERSEPWVVAAGFAAGSALGARIDGLAPPVPPATVNRDESGGATVRAIQLSEGIQLDGSLDEAVYGEVEPITAFIQQVPDEGAPATEKTEAWIMFADTNVYVSARVWDSAPESERVANEMRRDTTQLRNNDTFTVFFDTFYDRRNGFNFYTNPLGARSDPQFTNEGNPNNDWNPVWDVRTGRFDGGWTVEMEIPFKTLRYRSGVPQLWGVQLRRAIH